MIMKRIALGLASVALASATVAAPASATTTAPTPPPYRNSCNKDVAALPASVQGKPASFKAGSALGVYVWHEARGWRIRVTHNLPKTAAGKSQRIEVRGRVVASRPISKVRLVRLEDRQRGEWVAVQRPKRKVLDARFVNVGGVDGVDFAAGCAGKLTFQFWQITRNADGTVKRTSIPVFVGSKMTPLTATTVPGLDTTVTDRAKFVVLRTPVS
ncbi:MAG: hypothetical protein WCF04_12225 [Candidatus Nanopelagicales bacterium]